jgi:D-alanyl-D-alanine carboxypeptidase
MVGTSSSLRIGDRLKVIDLLYGMMLPSGNDAAFALAEVIGRESFFKSVEYRNLILENSYYVKKCKPEVAVRYFLRIMNKLAKKLNLKNAYFSNPHGLSKKTNQISTDDMCILVDFAVT